MPTDVDWSSPEGIAQDSFDKLKTKPLSFGEKLVGLNFNPSNDDDVSKATRLCADLADLVQQHRERPQETTQLETQLYNHTIGEILNAQMNVVKLLTLKY